MLAILRKFSFYVNVSLRKCLNILKFNLQYLNNRSNFWALIGELVMQTAGPVFPERENLIARGDDAKEHGEKRHEPEAE